MEAFTACIAITTRVCRKYNSFGGRPIDNRVAAKLEGSYNKEDGIGDESALTCKAGRAQKRVVPQCPRPQGLPVL